jgi:hypothetical protein
MTDDRKRNSLGQTELGRRPGGAGRGLDERAANGEQATEHPLPTKGLVLFGAHEISQFLFGSAAHRRRVYHLAEKHGLPVFHIGSTICAREVRITEWLAAKGGDVDASDKPLLTPRHGP